MNDCMRLPLRVTMMVFLVMGVVLTACGDEERTPPEPVDRVVMERDGETALYPATRFGEGYVSAIAWSPDDRWFAVVGAFGVRLYDATDFDQPPVLLPFDNAEGGGEVIFSPDSRWLVVADARGTVRTWDTMAADSRHVFQATEIPDSSAELDPLAMVSSLLAISEDNRWLAFRYLGTITRWDLTQGTDQQPDTYATPEGTVFSMTFDHDGRLLVAGSASDDQRLMLGNITVQPPPSDASLIDRTIRVWDVLSGDLVGALVEAPGRVRRLEFLRGGEEALTYFYDPFLSEGTISGPPVIWWNVARGEVLGQTLIDFAAGEPTFTGSLDIPLAVKLHTVSRGFSSAAQPGENANQQVFTLDFEDEQAQIVTQTELTILDVRTGKELVTLATTPEDEKRVFSHALFNRARTTLTTIDHYGRINFWTFTSPIERWVAQGPILLDAPTVSLDRYTMRFDKVAFRADGQQIAAVASTTQSVRVWDRATGEYTLYESVNAFLDMTDHKFRLDSVRFSGYSPDGARVALMEQANQAVIKERTTGEVVTVFAIPFRVQQAIFTPDGETVVLGGTNGMIGLWNGKSGYQEAMWQAHTSTIIELAFTPDGKRLISHGSTWHTSGASLAAAEALAGDETQRIGGITVSGSIRVSAGQQQDSEGTPVGGIDRPVMDNSIRVWDASTGQMLSILEPLADELFEALAVHPNGELLAVAAEGPERVIRVWSLTDEQVVATLYRRDLGLSDLAFSPDGSLLAATDRNGIVWVWELPEDAPPQ